MREIHVDSIVSSLRRLCIDANVEIRPDTLEAFQRALGPEAVFRRTVQRFPAIVVNDLHGGDIYTEGRNKYQRPWPKI